MKSEAQKKVDELVKKMNVIEALQAFKLNASSDRGQALLKYVNKNSHRIVSKDECVKFLVDNNSL